MDQENALIIRVTLTVKDLWRYSLHLSYRGLYGIFSLVYVVAGIYVIASTWSSISPLYRTLMIACYLLYMIYKPAFLYLKAYRQVESTSNQGDMTLSFGEEGVQFFRGEDGYEFSWNDVRLAEQVGNMLVLGMEGDYACLLPDSSTRYQKPVLGALLIKKLPPERRKRI